MADSDEVSEAAAGGAHRIDRVPASRIGCGAFAAPVAGNRGIDTLV
ncbi:hypothetical protein [Tepidimonas charontis]|nr:hypothetical protein [Tepidimonas charontis]